METYGSYTLHRILSRAVMTNAGCNEYRPGKLKHKYGLVSITIDGKRKSVPVHRALWMATNRRWDLPRHVVIRHKCDNPRCVNIEHLEEGTHKDNVRDKIERGRCARKYKPHMRVRKIDLATVRRIRKARGKLKDIAARFGVTTGYVSKLRNRKLKALA